VDIEPKWLAPILLVFIILVVSGLFHVLAEQEPVLPVVHPQQTKQTVIETLVVFLLYAFMFAGLLIIYNAPRTGRRNAPFLILIGATVLVLSAYLLLWLPNLKPYP